MKRSDISDRQVVLAAMAARAANISTIEVLKQCFPTHCLKVIWRAMERACSRCLVEYGTSLRYCWPTEKGLELLMPDTGRVNIATLLSVLPK